MIEENKLTVETAEEQPRGFSWGRVIVWVVVLALLVLVAIQLRSSTRGTVRLERQGRVVEFLGFMVQSM
jgi:hypothetical protein